MDSPVWNVRSSSVDMSWKAASYAMEDTVLKYQRIEADAAFVRDEAESAHIFPRAKCKGQYEWLDKAEFNRLALSPAGHIAFDGTNGRAVRPETQPKVAIEPVETKEITLERPKDVLSNCTPSLVPRPGYPGFLGNVLAKRQKECQR